MLFLNDDRPDLWDVRQRDWKARLWGGKGVANRVGDQKGKETNDTSLCIHVTIDEPAAAIVTARVTRDSKRREHKT